jgi:hypothetical protein
MKLIKTAIKYFIEKNSYIYFKKKIYAIRNKYLGGYGPVTASLWEKCFV